MTSYDLDIDCSSTLSTIVVVEKGTDSKGYIWGSGITNFLFITFHSLCTIPLQIQILILIIRITWSTITYTNSYTY
jgi:hypothetical protein